MDKIIAGLVALLAALFGRKASAPAPAASGSAAAPLPVSDSPKPVQAPGAPQIASDGLTARAAMELVGHEAIVCEAYKDSQHIWTWGIGVTDASGHNVARYIDNPQTVDHCLEIFIWLLRAKYLPAVLKAFSEVKLGEAQLAAALSFHYNTGAILHAAWVRSWLADDLSAARAEFMQWDKPPSIIERRQKECDLFFDGTWSSDGKAAVIPVLKPSYQPDFRHSARLDVLPALEKLLG